MLHDVQQQCPSHLPGVLHWIKVNTHIKLALYHILTDCITLTVTKIHFSHKLCCYTDFYLNILVID